MPASRHEPFRHTAAAAIRKQRSQRSRESGRGHVLVGGFRQEAGRVPPTAGQHPQSHR